jgi:hypothetical protein
LSSLSNSISDAPATNAFRRLIETERITTMQLEAGDFELLDFHDGILAPA